MRKPTPEPDLTDPDNPEVPSDAWQYAVPVRSLLEAAAESKRRYRGAQKAPTKQLVSLRLSRVVIAAYRRTGRGWQARINADLERLTAGPRRKSGRRAEPR